MNQHHVSTVAQHPVVAMGTPHYIIGQPIHPLPVTAVAAAMMAPTPPTITQMAPHIPKAIKETIMPENFYHLKPSALAQFSTLMGTKPKRDVPDPKPASIARANPDTEIQRKADELRREFPELAAAIKTPSGM
jgi:hypothetical protein